MACDAYDYMNADGLSVVKFKLIKVATPQRRGYKWPFMAVCYSRRTQKVNKSAHAPKTGSGKISWTELTLTLVSYTR